jgi:hypothetical protein
MGDIPESGTLLAMLAMQWGQWKWLGMRENHAL